MTWALKTATSHPELAKAMVNADGEWLDFLLEDGRTFRFRPGALIRPEAPAENREDILNRLISIGIKQASLPTVSERRSDGTVPGAVPPGTSDTFDRYVPGSERGGFPSSASAVKKAPEPSPDERPASDEANDPVPDAEAAAPAEAPVASSPAEPADAAETNAAAEANEPAEPADANEPADTNVPPVVVTSATEAAAEPAEPSDPGPEFEAEASSSASEPVFSRDGRESESGVATGPDVTPATEVLPIVRGADFFLRTHHPEDGMVYLPLTNFVGVGLSLGTSLPTQPVYFSQLGSDPEPLGELMMRAVDHLREQMNDAIELVVDTSMGANAALFVSPEGFQSSWFADVVALGSISQHFAEQEPDAIPLFVPVSFDKLLVVMSTDPGLAALFRHLLSVREDERLIYPLPHTLAADGWTEWVPFPGDELAETLGTLRNYFRAKIYDQQVRTYTAWGVPGALKEFIPRRLKTGERVSATEWDALDGEGSIPDATYITFTRAASPHPWERATPVSITVLTHVARELWPDGIERDPNAWPKRYRVKGFPDDATLLRLRDGAGRQF